jgi:hypothetical protein
LGHIGVVTGNLLPLGKGFGSFMISPADGRYPGMWMLLQRRQIYGICPPTGAEKTYSYLSVLCQVIQSKGKRSERNKVNQPQVTVTLE